MARGKRGGVQPPQAPQLVEGTGQVRPPTVAPGQAYGERQATEAQAAEQPMYDDGSGAQAPTGGVGLGPMPDAFGPTQRPNEPISAGQQPPGEYYDPVDVLRSIYNSYPSPWIAALLGDDY